MRDLINNHSIPSPSYIIDERKLLDNLRLLKRIKDETGIKIILAQKAFSNFSFYPLIGQYLDGAAASSVHEAKLAYEEMGLKVHSYSPAFKKSEFEAYLEYSSHIVFNSMSQFKHFQNEVKKNVNTHTFGLRVNPEYSEIKIPMYNPVISGSRFGVCYKDLNHLPKEITGFHFHALCENDSFTLERTLQRFESLFGSFLPQLEFLNLGGGHFITHSDYDVEHLIGLLQAFRQRYPHLEIIMEPGSAIALNTGCLLTSVVDIVESNGQHIAIIDASFTAHMPDCLEMPYQPNIISGNIGTTGPYVYKIGGNTCLSGDYIECYSFEKELNIGDRLIFEDQIHYTMVKTTQFNGVPLPSICKINQNNQVEILKTFNYSDYKSKLI